MHCELPSVYPQEFIGMAPKPSKVSDKLAAEKEVCWDGVCCVFPMLVLTITA